MLELKNISRIYRVDDVETRALDDVSASFRRSEFVSVLGPSGSGKTTLLNLIGGLDHYDDGDIVIDGVSTKDYSNRDWDAYRNHRIGFIFQNYNLINHQSVLDNVELALTLSGISGAKKRELAKEALERVGLGQHLNKRPSQLSGGQMQRVAIARAIVNNPDIILADEPTGALDSKTSIQIMDLLKEVAKDKLVIMVTHNPKLAKDYSSRIINVEDGKIVSDTKPYKGGKDDSIRKPERYTSLSLLTALKLSMNNLMTKRGRTILTTIAGSIGIIGIGIVLALANGAEQYADSILTDTSIASPITIERVYMDSSISSYGGVGGEKQGHDGALLAIDDLSNNSAVTRQQRVRFNDTKTLKKYLDEHKEETDDYIDQVSYDYDIKLDIYDGERKVNPVENSDETGLASLFADETQSKEVAEGDLLKSGFKEVVSNKPFELLMGRLPEKPSELILVVNQDKEISLSTAYALNLSKRTELDGAIGKLNKGEKYQFQNEVFEYSDIIGHKYQARFGDGTNEVLEVVGVATVKKSGDKSGYMGYTRDLAEKAVRHSNGEYNIDEPATISIYAKSEIDKDRVTTLLDSFMSDTGVSVYYVDQMKAMVGGVKAAISVASSVLIAFVAISLIVSSIMIGIITYISVLERTKEIGILRAIGASKRDVVRVFTAETIIEGLVAGVIGVVMAALLCLAINPIIKSVADVDNLARVSLIQSLILIAISVGLTMLAGYSPAKRASRKDPVEALRSE